MTPGIHTAQCDNDRVCLPVGRCHHGHPQTTVPRGGTHLHAGVSPLANQGPSAQERTRRGHSGGQVPHTHVVNLWLRYRDPLVDSQRCVTHSHPLLLPAEEEEEPVTRGLGGSVLPLCAGTGRTPLGRL